MTRTSTASQPSGKIARAVQEVAGFALQRIEHAVTGAVRPTMIANFAVTSRCNYRCASCGIGRAFLENPSVAERDMTLPEIEAFLVRDADTLRRVSWMQLTGGEPFLRADLVALVTTIAHHLPRCGLWIPTNGFAPDVIAERTEMMLAYAKRLGIGVSLHGDEAMHDRFTGVPGAHTKAAATLKNLAALRKRHPHLRLS
ncbi:MAG TPA: radical SAM protein, partial [Candidatus Hydrogenedentes bacterium]|nr:radical SAM protein [Candidatus Hydrogenedentota bacterium]